MFLRGPLTGVLTGVLDARGLPVIGSGTWPHFADFCNYLASLLKNSNYTTFSVFTLMYAKQYLNIYIVTQSAL